MTTRFAISRTGGQKHGYYSIFFMNAVVALGIDAPDNNKHWIGTGFIVGRRDPKNVDLLTYYLVTNKHVIAEPKRIYVRFNSLGSSLVKDYQA